MKTYKTRFERINFGYTPPLYQIADVVFQTDVPFEDGHLEEFERVVWDAMWKQNPHWGDPEGPLSDKAGWSSVLGGHDIEEIS